MTAAATVQAFDINGDMTFERASKVFDSINMATLDHSEITINLAAVEQSDSAALAIMLEWTNQARKNRKTVRFSNVPNQLMRLIELTRLEKILKLVPVT